MALYKIAEHLTGQNEGFYANSRNDRGKETFAGIARFFWTNWPGWAIIDQIKKNVVKPGMDIHDRNVWKLINKEAKKYPELIPMISEFYEGNFWDINNLSLIKDQQISNTVYDFSVNSGEDEAAETLQEVANIITGNNPRLATDGDIGRKTLDVVNSLNPKEVHDLYNEKREKFYRKLAERPSQADFLTSWLRRLKPYNEMKMIQYKLGLAADGVYGPNTKAAISKFQEDHGLMVDGIPGAETMKKFYQVA